MLVKLTQDAQVFWNHRLVDLKEGDEVRGEFAQYLNDNGHPVEVLDASGEGPDPRRLTDPLAGPRTDKRGQVVVERPKVEDGVIEEPNIARPVPEIIRWVNGDPERARQARQAELAKGDDARSTLVGQLDAIVGE